MRAVIKFDRGKSPSEVLDGLQPIQFHQFTDAHVDLFYMLFRITFDPENITGEGPRIVREE